MLLRLFASGDGQVDNEYDSPNTEVQENIFNLLKKIIKNQDSVEDN